MGYRVKVFTDTGHHGIETVEQRANDFLKELNPSTEVISISPSMCSIGEADSEIYQCFTITIAYRS
jgi:hypothetical protein